MNNEGQPEVQEMSRTLKHDCASGLPIQGARQLFCAGRALFLVVLHLLARVLGLMNYEVGRKREVNTFGPDMRDEIHRPAIIIAKSFYPVHCAAHFHAESDPYSENKHFWKLVRVDRVCSAILLTKGGPSLFLLPPIYDPRNSQG